MEATKQTETPQPTPEQLLKLLDLQMERERSKRASRSRNRATFLAVGILSILAAAGVALIVAQGLMMELREQGGQQANPGQMEEER